MLTDVHVRFHLMQILMLPVTLNTYALYAFVAVKSGLYTHIFCIAQTTLVLISFPFRSPLFLVFHHGYVILNDIAFFFTHGWLNGNWAMASEAQNDRKQVLRRQLRYQRRLTDKRFI